MKFFALLLATATVAFAHGPGKEGAFEGRRVLLIGIDGCRSDALKKAVDGGRAPNLAGLIKAGTVTWTAYTGGEPGGELLQDTVSGPGWTTILTGVWRDRHGVADNLFRLNRIAQNPHLFRRLKDANPKAWVGSLCDWPEIHNYIVGASQRGPKDFMDFLATGIPDPARKGTDYAEKDAALTAHAVGKLRDLNPDALFMYFGNVDEMGHGAAHKDGRFSPDNEHYLGAIAAVDKHVGELLVAIRARPRFVEENWLVLAMTDHGGTGTSHGKQSPEERTIWMIASGGDAPRGKVIEGATPQTAIAPTVFRHLGLPAPKEWTVPFALPGK
jgi:predicted AlkP superfamily pyrophosphatase or phosphodiesterase